MFAGWYTDAEFTNIFNFDAVITEDTKLYAKWIEKTCDTIAIETIGSPIIMSINGKTEQLLAFVPSVSATITVTSTSELDLIGCLYDANKDLLISADDIDDNNLNFSFTYNVEAGKVYYIDVRGNTIATVGNAEISINWVGNCSISGTTYTQGTLTYVYGSQYILPDYVEKEGYTFICWFDDNNQQYVSGTWNYTTDISLHAVFEKNS